MIEVFLVRKVNGPVNIAIFIEDKSRRVSKRTSISHFLLKKFLILFFTFLEKATTVAKAATIS